METAGTLFAAKAVVSTAHASRYLQQLCKHWQHNLAVEFDATRGKITFPRDARGADWPDAGVVTLAAGTEALTCWIEASAEGQLEGLKGAVERHVERFAFREELVWGWEGVA